MDLPFFLRGLSLGILIAAPVGPIGILAIRRTLTLGPLAGLLTGLGAATADGLYGCIAAFGLTVVSDLLVHQAVGLRILGGLVLCYLGITTFRTTPKEKTLAAATQSSPADPSPRPSYLVLYGSTVLLTLTNPLTIFSFAAVFAGLGLVANYANAAILVAGVFTGSALWWLFLSFSMGLLRTRMNSLWLQRLNQISGSILLVFGIIALGAWG